jgi:hypothetical protein
MAAIAHWPENVGGIMKRGAISISVLLLAMLGFRIVYERYSFPNGKGTNHDSA